jgi:AraC-like DNA-binding protein
MNPEMRAMISQQLIDLLALALKADDRTITSGHSTMRTAHLMRIESFVCKNLRNPALDPDMIARNWGISIRYLHELFRDTNQSLGGWIRDQRLDVCRAALGDRSITQSVGEIAYHWSFGDQAQFSRVFKAHFGVSSKEYRDEARRRARLDA